MRHEPPGYRCPFCALASGKRGVAITSPDEIVFEDRLTLAFVGSHGFGNRPGHVLVVPRDHYENLFDLPEAVGHAIFSSVQRLAICLRERLGAEGITLRQHNGPAGQQDVWHFHVHVMPRWPEDGVYGAARVPLALEQRLELARVLRD